MLLASLPTRGVWIEIKKILGRVIFWPCRSPHGECGLKSRRFFRGGSPRRRSPHGECGLKSVWLLHTWARIPSLPTRGVWIEIGQLHDGENHADCRSPHGECGLKYVGDQFFGRHLGGRSPHGECGLKSIKWYWKRAKWWSLPTRGVWIEILYQLLLPLCSRSLPTRGVWIEIRTGGGETRIITVAPHTGSVD